MSRHGPDATSNAWGVIAAFQVVNGLPSGLIARIAFFSETTLASCPLGPMAYVTRSPPVATSRFPSASRQNVWSVPGSISPGI